MNYDTTCIKRDGTVVKVHVMERVKQGECWRMLAVDEHGNRHEMVDRVRDKDGRIFMAREWSLLKGRQNGEAVPSVG